MRLYWNKQTGEFQTERPARKLPSYQVLSDIKPFVNVIDGKEIGSRSQKRAMMRAYQVEEVGNERLERRRPEPEGVARSIAEAYDKIEAGYRG